MLFVSSPASNDPVLTRAFAPQVLLAGLRVRPSADGILDGESQDGSLLDELKTSDEDKPPARSKARAGAGRKSMTTARKGKGKQEAVSDVDEAEEEVRPIVVSSLVRH